LGKSLVETCINPEYQGGVSKVFVKTLRDEDTANFEFPLFSKNDNRLDILLNASTRLNLVSKASRVVGVGQSITKIRQADRSRKRVTEDLRSLIDHANAPIFGIDVHWSVIVWNQAASGITGYTNKELLDKSLVQTYINPEYQGFVSKLFILTETLFSIIETFSL